jgi:hypothetical protein
MTIARTAAATVLAFTLLTAACGDDDTGVRAGDVPADTSDGDTSLPSEDPEGTEGTVPDAAPDITGTVTSVAPFEPITEGCTPAEDLDPDGSVSSEDPPICTPPDNDVLGTVLVEEQPGVQEGRKISFTVTTSTVLTGADGAPLREFADLAAGQTVDAWSPGICAESYPEQCSAVAIQRQA